MTSDCVFNNSHCAIVTRVNEHRFASDVGHLSTIYQNLLASDKNWAKIMQCELGINLRHLVFPCTGQLSAHSGGGAKVRQTCQSTLVGGACTELLILTGISGQPDLRKRILK